MVASAPTIPQLHRFHSASNPLLHIRNVSFGSNFRSCFRDSFHRKFISMYPYINVVIQYLRLNQRISPLKNSGLIVLKVYSTCQVSHDLAKVFTSHSPPNPGNRVLPVRSCCIVACLISRFLAMSLSSDVIRASTSLRAAAMARCSGRGGRGIRIVTKAFFVNLYLPAPWRVKCDVMSLFWK